MSARGSRLATETQERFREMRTQRRTTACLVLLGVIMAGALTAATGQTIPQRDEQQIQALQKDYVQAVDKLDFELVSAIWSHDPTVSFVHPRGTAVGFVQIRDVFYRDTMGLFSERDLQLENPELHIYGDAAWSEMTWTFHGTMKDGGQKIVTKGRETQIYRKENGTWRIVHVHYSGPPDTRPLKGF